MRQPCGPARKVCGTLPGERHDIGIARCRRDLGDVDDVMIRAAKMGNQGSVDAFVDQPAHG
jgi:hypothetical protein